MIDFILGGVAGGLVVFGFLLLWAFYDWFDMRGARRIQRANARRAETESS